MTRFNFPLKRLGLLLIICVELSHGWDANTMWSHHPRPQYLFSENVKKHQSHDVFERPTNLMRTAMTYIREHPEIVPSVELLMRRLDDAMVLGSSADKSSRSSVFTCPQYGEYPCESPSTVSDLGEPDSVALPMVDQWQSLVSRIMEDSQECTDCVDFWTFMKQAGCNGLQWEDIRQIVIDWCSANLPLEPFICEGVVTIQGEHVYCIVLQADPRDLCESLNNCFPPEDRPGRPPVSDRTPWAVKAQMEARGTWPPTVQKVKRTGKRTPEGDMYIKIGALTDVHIQPRHSVGSATECNSDVCCLEEAPGQGSARYWGEYTCNLPLHTMQLFLDRVRGMQPDFVLYAGDSPPHTMYDETENSQLNCSQIIVDAMYKSFGPDLRVYPAIGNHEMFPTNLYSPYLEETKRMAAGFTKMWSTIAGFTTDNNDTFADLSYYSTVIRPGLRIVTINTELDWYTANFYSTLNQNIEENNQHKQWVNDTLKTARSNNEKVILLSHHPAGGGDCHTRGSRWWEQIAIEFGDIIVLHVSGHTHSDELRLSFDPHTMEPKLVNHVASTVNSKRYVNPSMMVYYLDPTNFTLVTFESFYLEIKEQEQSIGVPPAIAFSYEAREEYGMSDLSPESYKQLILRFLDDDELFWKYHLNRNSHADAETTSCDYSCKMSAICGIWFADLAEATECRANIPAVSTSPPGTTPVGGVAAPVANAILVCLSMLFVAAVLKG